MQGSGERLKVEEKGIDRKHVKRPQVLTSRASQKTQKNKKPGLPAGKEAASEIGIRLLQDQAGVGATGAGGVIVDHARVIRTVHQLTRPADYLGRGGDDESDRRNGAVTCPHEGVARLPALGKEVIDQAGLRRRDRTRIRATQSSQLCREP